MAIPRDAIESAETEMRRAADAAVRNTLTWWRTRALQVGRALTAATATDLDELLEGLFAKWDEQVHDEIADMVERLFRRGADGTLGEAGERTLARYLAKVPNRLTPQGVAGREVGIRESARIGVTTPEEMMIITREVLATSLAAGHDRKRTVQRLGTALAWEPDRGEARKEVDALDREIDSILDAIGPPGSPAREAVRLHDPRIQKLQGDRAFWVSRRDESESRWQKRAERITRTETTGALNGGEWIANVEKARAQGRTLYKAWNSAEDSRTRASHVAADNQCRPVEAPFLVNGREMMFPGDPNGGASEVINCRCATLYADDACPEGTNQPDAGDTPPPIVTPPPPPVTEPEPLLEPEPEPELVIPDVVPLAPKPLTQWSAPEVARWARLNDMDLGAGAKGVDWNTDIPTMKLQGLLREPLTGRPLPPDLEAWKQAVDEVADDVWFKIGDIQNANIVHKDVTMIKRDGRLFAVTEQFKKRQGLKDVRAVDDFAAQVFARLDLAEGAGEFRRDTPMVLFTNTASPSGSLASSSGPQIFYRRTGTPLEEGESWRQRLLSLRNGTQPGTKGWPVLNHERKLTDEVLETLDHETGHSILWRWNKRLDDRQNTLDTDLIGGRGATPSRGFVSAWREDKAGWQSLANQWGESVGKSIDNDRAVTVSGIFDAPRVRPGPVDGLLSPNLRDVKIGQTDAIAKRVAPWNPDPRLMSNHDVTRSASPASYGGRGDLRLGVSPYGATLPEELWAETWRTLIFDAREGRLGTTGWPPDEDSKDIRFFDLYPEVAAYIRRMAVGAEVDLDPRIWEALGGGDE